jgi:hypothetical protein
VAHCAAGTYSGRCSILCLWRQQFPRRGLIPASALALAMATAMATAMAMAQAPAMGLGLVLRLRLGLRLRPGLRLGLGLGLGLDLGIAQNPISPPISASQHGGANRALLGLAERRHRMARWVARPRRGDEWVANSGARARGRDGEIARRRDCEIARWPQGLEQSGDRPHLQTPLRISCFADTSDPAPDLNPNPKPKPKPRPGPKPSPEPSPKPSQRRHADGAGAAWVAGNPSPHSPLPTSHSPLPMRADRHILGGRGRPTVRGAWAIGRRLPAVGPRPPAVGRRPPALGRRPSATGRRPSAVGPRPSAVGPRPPAVGPRPPDVSRRPPATERRGEKLRAASSAPLHPTMAGHLGVTLRRRPDTNPGSCKSESESKNESEGEGEGENAGHGLHYHNWMSGYVYGGAGGHHRLFSRELQRVQHSTPDYGQKIRDFPP